MLREAEVCDIVCVGSRCVPETIGYDDNLVVLGMHSMNLMHLADVWRKQGYQERSSRLALEPTVATRAEQVSRILLELAETSL